MENQNWGTPKLRGRGMVKWQPFASLPEQLEGIREILNDLNKVPKPIITEDMKEQLQIGLVQSIQNKEEIHISYYRDEMVQDMYINVLHIEPMTRIVYCTDTFGLNTEFRFNELVSLFTEEVVLIFRVIHRHVKRHFVKSTGFQTIRHASRTIKGIETIQAIYKQRRSLLSDSVFSAYTELQQLLVAS